MGTPFMYQSPAYGGYQNNSSDEDFYDSAPRASHGRRAPSYAPGIPRMSAPPTPPMSPYGGAMDSYDGPFAQSPQPMANAPMGQAPSLQSQNMGRAPRGLSLGSTVGRITNLASNPIAGAVASRMPGNAPYSDILNAGMAPVLANNRMMNTQAGVGESLAPFAPQMAQQQVRGATLRNDYTQQMTPGAVGMQTAQTGLVNAEAGATTAMGGNTAGDVSRYQRETQQHMARADKLQGEVDRLNGQLARLTQQGSAAANKPDKPEPQHTMTESEYMAAQDPNVGYGGVVAMRKGKMPGDPSTRPVPVTQPTQQAPATADEAARRAGVGTYGGGQAAASQPTTGPAGAQANAGGKDMEFKYQLGPDGKYHRAP